VKSNPQAPLILTAALGAVWWGLVVFNLCTERHSIYRGLNPEWMLPALVFLPLALFIAGRRLGQELPRGLGWRQGLWLLFIIGPPMLLVALPLTSLLLPMVIANGWEMGMHTGTLFALMLALVWLVLLAVARLTLRSPAPGKPVAAVTADPPADERPGGSGQDTVTG